MNEYLELLKLPPLTEVQEAAMRNSFGVSAENLWSKSNRIHIATLEWGKGSGKDMMAATFVSWCAYTILLMRKPREFFGMPTGEDIDILNVAPSGQQGEDIFFSKLTSRLESSLFDPFKPRIKGRSIIFPSSPVRLYSMHSESETYEGYNVLVWVLDEASAFTNRSKRRNANAVFRTLNLSAKTRFKHHYKGLILSYPRTGRREDFTSQMVDKAADSPSRYGETRATYHVLPWMEREDFAEEFEEDPIGTALAIECFAPEGVGKFFSDAEATSAAFVSDPNELVEYESMVTVRNVETPDGTIHKEYAAFEYLFKRENFPTKKMWHIHGDPGLAADSFSICAGYSDDGLIRIPLGLRWVPFEKLQVDFWNVADFIIDLAKVLRETGNQVVLFTADQWNSAMLIQHLMENGVPARDLSFSRKMQTAMYVSLRHSIRLGLVRGLAHPTLKSEILQLEKINGRVDHPTDGSKDMADAFAAVNWFVGEEGQSSVKDGEIIVTDLLSDSYYPERQRELNVTERLLMENAHIVDFRSS